MCVCGRKWNNNKNFFLQFHSYIYFWFILDVCGRSKWMFQVCVCLYVKVFICIQIIVVLDVYKSKDGVESKCFFNSLTLLAQLKHVETTFDMIFIRFFVSCITWSTLTNVAALPTVWSLTVNCSVCTYVGTLSKWANNSFFGSPAGTWWLKKGKGVSRFYCHPI